MVGAGGAPTVYADASSGADSGRRDVAGTGHAASASAVGRRRLEVVVVEVLREEGKVDDAKVAG